MTDAPQTARSVHVGTYLTEAEAAEFSRFTRGTLRNMRSLGQGPKFLRVGGTAIRYRLDDLVAWMEGDGA